jgi:cytochrome c553
VRRALAFAALACLAVGAAAAQTPAEVDYAPPVEVDYALQCRGCHGPDGAGVAGHVPSLAGVGTLLATPAGRARLLAVPGVRQASLSDERLAALLAWAAVRFAPPGEAPAFAPLSAAEVARLRATEPGN